MSLKPKDCRVLIIDDNVDAAELMKMLFRLEGFTADIALTGTSGLSKAADFSPQAICIDIDIFDLSYDGLIRAIQQLNFPHHVLMIGMTSWDRAHHPSPQVWLQFDTVYVKPVEIDAIVSQIRSYCYG